MSNLNEVSTCKQIRVYVLQKNICEDTVTKFSSKKEEHFDRKIKKHFPLFTG